MEALRDPCQIIRRFVTSRQLLGKLVSTFGANWFFYGVDPRTNEKGEDVDTVGKGNPSEALITPELFEKGFDPDPEHSLYGFLTEQQCFLPCGEKNHKNVARVHGSRGKGE